MSTIGKDVARGCGRAVIVRLLAIAIGLPLGCTLVFTILWLVNTLYGRVSPGLLIGGGVVLGLLPFGGGAAVLGLVVYRRKQKLDAIFCPLGLQGQTYLSFFRQYHGMVNGRQVAVYLARGPRMEIEVSTALQTRLGVTGPHGDTRFLAGLVNKSPLPVADPSLTVFPHDEAWARALFDDPEAVEIFRRLTTLESIFTRQQVIVRPGTFQLLLSGSTQWLGFDPDPALMQRWVHDLLRLVQIAERLPAPTTKAELSSLEQRAYRVRQANPYLALWFGLGLLGFFAVVAVAAAILVMVLSNLS
ncbi:MAG TPA: hypothetical protein ENN99_03870 [Chloroflexi bacterium]|nr:hypothetical protein [Chloroflexota bacterium]